MILESERRKCEEEMREFIGGSIIIPDGVNLSSIGRRRIRRTVTKKEPKKKERISIVASITRIINRLRR